MFSVQSKSCLNVLPLVLLRVAFTAALTFVLTGVVGTHAEAATRLPDLIVSAVSAPSTASSGTTIGISASIKNQGRATSSAFSVSYYGSTIASSIAGAALLGVQNVASLPSGTSIALVTSLAIPPSAASGTFYLVAVADSANVVRESKETNNTRASGAIAVKDLTPPTISGVNATQITASNATITWTTDKTSTSQADYGTTAAYGSATSPNSSLVTSHAVTLSGLAAGKAYHFRVQSTDAAGNAALSSDYTFTTATATAGNTYYVATTGSDANPGTETQPFRTLTQGVSVLIPGDTLYILSGTYAESLIDNIPAGISWSTPVTVAAAPGHTVTLKSDPGANFVLHFQGPQQYIVIDGLVLDATNVTYDAVKITAGGGQGAAHHIRLIRCEVKYSHGQGVLVAEIGADWNEFIDLNAHDNGATDLDHGLYISTSHNLVEKSTVHHNAGYGVHVYNGYVGQSADNNIVRNNQVYDNNQSQGYGAGILLASGDSNIAYNNLIWGSSHYVGLQIGFSASNPMAYNNTIYNNHYGVDIGSSSSNAVIQNNIVYSSSASNYANRGVGTVADHNLIGTNPSFVNAAAADFRLQWGSPAIDAGVTVSSVTTDIAGSLRPQGGGYDLGAFELVP